MTADDVEDLPRSFKGACLSLRANYPPWKSAVKLTNGKATEVFQVYLVCGVTRAGDNVVFVREPCNLFDPSCVKVGLSRTGVYTLFGVFRGQSLVYYKSVRDSA